MKTIRLGGELEATSVGLGCMRMETLEIKEAGKVIDTALEEGITFFDHADCYGYGKSEEVFSRAFKEIGKKREQIVLQSKCGIRKSSGRCDFLKQYYDFSKEHIIEAAEGILKRLDTEYLDILLLHRPDALVEPEEVAEAFERLREQGKVRYFGVSNESPELIRLLQENIRQKLIVNQLQFSPVHTCMINQQTYMNMYDDRAAGRSCEALEFCRRKKITVQAWSPFQHGFFEGTFIGNSMYPELNEVLNVLAFQKNVSPEAIVISWIMRHPAKIQTIIGTMTPGRIRRIAKGSDVELSREEWYEIYSAGGSILP